MIEDALRDELKELCKVLDELGAFRIGVTVEVRKILENRNCGFKKIKLMIDSIRVEDGVFYCVADVCDVEKMFCIAEGAVGPPSLFKNNLVVEFDGYKVFMVDFNADNLRKFLKERPEFGPKNLGKKARLGLGVRMLFTLQHLVNVLKEINIPADFQLSAGREFSLKDVVDAPPGVYPEWLGHTGLDAETLYSSIALGCFKMGFDNYGTEIDHLIVVRQPSRALTRILSHGEQMGESDSEGLEASMDYNRRIIDEATETGFVRGITVDASDLIRYEFTDLSKWSTENVREKFLMEFGEEAEEVLHNIQPYHCYTLGDVKISFSEEDVIRTFYKTGSIHTLSDFSKLLLGDFITF